MLSRKWLWLSLASLTFLLSGLAYYLFIYRPAQSPIELQEPAPNEGSIPIAQRTQAINENSDIEVAPSTTPVLSAPQTEAAEVLHHPLQHLRLSRLMTTTPPTSNRSTYLLDTPMT